MINPLDGTIIYKLQIMRRTAGPITDVFLGVSLFLGATFLAVLLILLAVPATGSLHRTPFVQGV